MFSVNMWFYSACEMFLQHFHCQMQEEVYKYKIELFFDRIRRLGEDEFIFLLFVDYDLKNNSFFSLFERIRRLINCWVIYIVAILWCRIILCQISWYERFSSLDEERNEQMRNVCELFAKVFFSARRCFSIERKRKKIL